MFVADGDALGAHDLPQLDAGDVAVAVAFQDGGHMGADPGDDLVLGEPGLSAPAVSGPVPLPLRLGLGDRVGAGFVVVRGDRLWAVPVRVGPGDRACLVPVPVLGDGDRDRCGRAFDACRPGDGPQGTLFACVFSGPGRVAR